MNVEVDMKVLQINAIYEKYSTGRITMELHETLLSWGIESYVASPNLNGLKNNCYLIGSNIDHKIHAIISRVIRQDTEGLFQCT